LNNQYVLLYGIYGYWVAYSHVMKPILVIYATREGHTQRIAEHIRALLDSRQRTSELVDAAHLPQGFSLTNYSAAIVGASLHTGKHEPEMVKFVKRHLNELPQIPTLFLSVSLSERTVEDPHALAEKRAQAEADVERTIASFLKETGWRPSHVAAVAGALLYSKYNFVVRFIMKRIANKAGGPVDTSRDYEFTDWLKLDRLIEEFLESTSAAHFPGVS
jgi:menaquinone-dependent protoporphyrinogen oxidase